MSAVAEERAAESPGVTILVTTSPIPSHPSAALLRALFASFREHLPGLERCPRLLVCDGFASSTEEVGRRPGKAQLCSQAAYDGFLGEVDRLADSGELGSCQVLRLPSRRGYGLALAEALRHVATERVLVVQHDWLFVRSTDVLAAAAAMDADREVKYIGMQSLTTLGYERRIQVRYGLEVPPAREVRGIRLVPQLLWYDKPHLARVSHYREEVLPRAGMSIGDCPERSYGVEVMWPLLQGAADLQEAHSSFGTFFWDVGAEVVYHLSGRKLHADLGSPSPPLQPAATAGGPPPPPAASAPVLLAELQGTATATATFTAAAVERVAVVPGLAAPSKAGLQPGKFRGHCFICGRKGHSKLRCPGRRLDDEERLCEGAPPAFLASLEPAAVGGLQESGATHRPH